MKSTFKYFSILVVTIISTYSQMPQAQEYPGGSYQKSCSQISVKDNQLSANCRTLNGSMNSTVLHDLQFCLNSITQDGDIGNIDGSLICLADLPKKDPSLTFPQSETTINQWVYSNDLSNAHKHAWGIWAGLTSYVGKVDSTWVRAFETWNTTSNMLYQIESAPKFGLKQSIRPAKGLSLDLMLPNQFKNKKGGNKLKISAPEDGDTNIFVSVAYNPPAARHAINNKLFLQSTLNRFLKEGYTEIPNFPVNAITIKPVYKVIPKNVANGIYKFPGWPGTPVVARAFPEKDWNSCVYIDIKKTGKGGSSIDKGCKGRSSKNTFHLNNFIHQKINEKDANFLSKQLSIKVSGGDYAILVGMHVTTRETKRWTWQTFWWSANPKAPYLPSSKEIANSRPLNSLDEAAKHYAMSVAYQMVSPAQPITNGVSVGSSVIGYNPHLEAGFDRDTFQINKGINGKAVNQYGVQTNCMTCHNLALYNPKTDYKVSNGVNREKPYGTDYYMSISDKTFDGSLKLDFAWSILGSLKLDDPQ